MGQGPFGVSIVPSPTCFGSVELLGTSVLRPSMDEYIRPCLRAKEPGARETVLRQAELRNRKRRWRKWGGVPQLQEKKPTLAQGVAPDRQLQHPV